MRGETEGAPKKQQPGSMCDTLELFYAFIMLFYLLLLRGGWEGSSYNALNVSPNFRHG